MGHNFLDILQYTSFTFYLLENIEEDSLCQILLSYGSTFVAQITLKSVFIINTFLRSKAMGKIATHKQ